MQTNKYIFFLLISVHLLLSACSGSRPHAVQAEDDLVNISNLGETNKSSSLIGVKPMSFEELTDCAKKAEEMRKNSIILKSSLTELALKKESLKKENVKLETDRASMDKYNTKAVISFNKRIEQNSAALSELNGEVNHYNKKILEENTQQNEFNINCAKRPYRYSDLSRLTIDIRHAIESISEKSDIPLMQEEDAINNLSNKLHFSNASK
jgi:uncharacterized protein (DUF342 family)